MNNTWMELPTFLIMISIMIFIYGKYRPRDLEIPLEEFSKDDIVYMSSIVFFIAGIIVLFFHFL